MKSQDWRSSLLAILFSGLALGSLGLLEPLLRFRHQFHLLGVPWHTLLQVYLGGGLVIAAAAGLPVAVWLARKPSRLRVLGTAAYHAAATVGLTAVLVAARWVHREALGLQMPLSYAIIFPVLIALATLLVVKLTPHLFAPLLGLVIGRRGDQVSSARLAALLLVIGLAVPATIAKDLVTRHRVHRRPRPELQSRPGTQPVQNVLLVTVDAMRADHLSLYGYDRQTSPHLEALAAEATVFDQCFAQGNCTELSMGALFTSLYPTMHTVKRHGRVANSLPPELETLAEGLRDAGLHTVGLVNNPLLKREFGLTQGLVTLDEFHLGYEELLPVRYLQRLRLLPRVPTIPETRNPRAAFMVDAAIRRLEQFRDRPLFMHLHLMDVHHPYIPPAPYQSMFVSPEAARTEAVEVWKRGWPLFQRLPAESDVLSPADVQRIIDLYDGAVRYADDEIGRLLAALEELGLAERTLVIVTSDHGDEFVDHGDIFHKSPFLYDELIHVPLIVRFPGQPGGRRIAKTVRHIDILPTLREVFELPPSPAAQGQSLLPLLTGIGAWAELPAFSESYEFVAVRTHVRKLMIDRRAGGRSYCFALDVDPAETTAAPADDETCRNLEGELLDFLRRLTVPPPGRSGQQLDRRTQEQLRSIGYL